MSSKSLMKIIDDQQWLENAGEAIQPVILNAFKQAGKQEMISKTFCMVNGWVMHFIQ